MSTKTATLWAKHTRQFRDNLRQLGLVALLACWLPARRATKVTFPYGLKTLTGVVMDPYGYKSTSIRVKTKTGAEHRVDCQHLKPVEAATNEGTS